MKLGARLVRRGQPRHRKSFAVWGTWLWLAAALFIAMAWTPHAYAQDSDIIEIIAVQGNQRVEPGTIRTYLTVREGDPFDPVRIDRSLKALFATSLFANVEITRRGNT